MDTSTSASCSLRYALNEFQRPRGRSSTTWLCIMKEQLNKKLSVDWNETFNIAKEKTFGRP